MTLLIAGRNSILRGIEADQSSYTPPQNLPPSLTELRATFVTLATQTGLRGCIGTLEAQCGLHDSVVENAYAAAFDDPRFPALTRPELVQLSIEISVLGQAERVSCHTEALLLCEMNRDRSGWILQEHEKRSTFLPSVWSSVNDARTFLDQLKLKAGLPRDYWSDELQFSRYTTTSFSAQFSKIPLQTEY